MFTDTLFNFLKAISFGYGHLRPAFTYTLEFVLILDITLLGLMWALGKGEIITDSLRKILKIGFFMLLIFEFPIIHKAILDTMINAGLTAGGGNMKVHVFTDPSLIISYGLQVVQAVLSSPSKSLVDQFMTAVSLQGIVILLAALILFLCYVIIAAQVVVTLIEFYLLSVVAVFFLPFSLFRHTAFLGEKSIGMIVGYGVKLLVLAFILSVVSPVLMNLELLEPGVVTDYGNVLAAAGTAILILMLTWNVPSVAASFLTGGPSLTAGSMASATMAGAAAGGLSTFAAVKALRTAAAGTVAGTAAAANLSSSVAHAAQMGASAQGGSVVSQAVGAIKGVGGLTGNAVGNVADTIRSSFSEAVASGRAGSGPVQSPSASSGSTPASSGKTGETGAMPPWASTLSNASHVANRVVPPESHPQGQSSTDGSSKDI